MAVERGGAMAPQEQDEGEEPPGDQPDGPVQAGELRASPVVFEGRKQGRGFRAQPRDAGRQGPVESVNRTDGEERREHAPAPRGQRRGVLEGDAEQQADEQREAEVQFVVVVENGRGDERDEQSAQRAAGGDQQVEGGELRGRGAQAVEFPVADHGADKQGRRVDDDLVDDGQIGAGE